MGYCAGAQNTGQPDPRSSYGRRAANLRFSADFGSGETHLIATDYATVTELPGGRASAEQLARLYHRYWMAARYSEGKEILEVGCGAGQGLGYLEKRAKRVIGGDYSETPLRFARDYWRGSVPLVRLDAHRLPFAEKSFDLLILYEAIYYLTSPEEFLLESRRLLRKGGLLILCTANKDWRDFNPSPFSVRYYSVPELVAMLRAAHFAPEAFGAFPASTGSVKDRVISLLKRTAVALHLMPKTMKGKEVLKRIFFGRLSAIPPEVEEGMAEIRPPDPISCGAPDFDHKVIYLVGHAC